MDDIYTVGGFFLKHLLLLFSHVLTFNNYIIEQQLKSCDMFDSSFFKTKKNSGTLSGIHYDIMRLAVTLNRRFSIFHVPHRKEGNSKG